MEFFDVVNSRVAIYSIIFWDGSINVILAQVILCQTPDTLSGVCETLKLYKKYGVKFSKIGFWDGEGLRMLGFQINSKRSGSTSIFFWGVTVAALCEREFGS